MSDQEIAVQLARLVEQHKGVADDIACMRDKVDRIDIAIRGNGNPEFRCVNSRLDTMEMRVGILVSARSRWSRYTWSIVKGIALMIVGALIAFYRKGTQ